MRAQIAQVGATLRTFTVNGMDVIDGFGADERSIDGRGQVLAPWPNRLTDGSYRYGGRDCQAPLNEVSRHDAIHGLVRWLDWTLLAHDSNQVTLACAVRPQPGYEWQLDLQITYTLDGAGLTVTFIAVNTDSEAGPVRRRIPPVPHARHGHRRQPGTDRARHRLPRPRRSRSSAEHDTGRVDAP